MFASLTRASMAPTAKAMQARSVTHVLQQANISATRRSVSVRPLSTGFGVGTFNNPKFRRFSTETGGPKRDQHGMFVFSVLGLVCAGAAVWQWRRYEYKLKLQASRAAKMDFAPVPLDTLLETHGKWDDLTFRPTQVSGKFLYDKQTLIGPRSVDGTSGYNIITPLVVDRMRTILVNRGWVPASEVASIGGMVEDETNGQSEFIGVLRDGEKVNSFVLGSGGSSTSSIQGIKSRVLLDLSQMAKELKIEPFSWVQTWNAHSKAREDHSANVPEVLPMHLIAPQSPTGQLPRRANRGDFVYGGLAPERHLQYIGFWASSAVISFVIGLVVRSRGKLKMFR